MTVFAKMFFQSLWNYRSSREPDSRSLYWDDVLPNSLMKEWSSVFNKLSDTSFISIPRWVSYVPSDYFEVHGFGDASSKAIAAAVYIRVITADQFKSSLLVAKTK